MKSEKTKKSKKTKGKEYKLSVDLPDKQHEMLKKCSVHIIVNL